MADQIKHAANLLVLTLMQHNLKPGISFGLVHLLDLRRELCASRRRELRRAESVPDADSGGKPFTFAS